MKDRFIILFFLLVMLFVPINMNNIINAATIVQCLYGLGDSKVCIDSSMPWQINLSLGEAVAAFGIIFAVYQLRSPTWRISLRIKEGYLSSLVWILSGIGLFFVFLASLTPRATSLTESFPYPIFWEHLGFLFLVSAPVSLLMIASQTKGLFNPARAKKFYHVLLQSASTGYQEDLESSITVIHKNLETLIDAIKLIENQEPDRDSYQLYAQDLLELLFSEKPIADYIVTYRIGFLFALLHQIKDKQLSQITIGMGFQKIVRCLFENPNSYLYKQLDYQGLTLYAPIYDVLFGNTYFIEEFSVLSMWDEYGISEEIRSSPQYAQTYLHAVEKAIDANKFQNAVASQRIASTLIYRLCDYAQHITSPLRTRERSQYSTILMYIEIFFGRDFPLAYKKYADENVVSIFEKDSKKDSTLRQSLTATYAEALVKFLGIISSIDDRKLERDYALSATRELLPIHDDGGIFDNIRKCFFEYLWEEIENNVKHGYFPAVLRIYIQMMYWNDNSMPHWRKIERKRLIEYLYKELRPRIKKGELMANYKDKKEYELLPSEVVFDQKRNKFYIIHRNGTRVEFK